MELTDKKGQGILDLKMDRYIKDNDNMIIPWCVAAVCDGHISDPEVIEHAQITETAVDGMTSLQPK